VRFVTNLSGEEVGHLPYERMSLDVLDASPEVSFEPRTRNMSRSDIVVCRCCTISLNLTSKPWCANFYSETLGLTCAADGHGCHRTRWVAQKHSALF
jgi:hypothetical protein